MFFVGASESEIHLTPSDKGQKSFEDNTNHHRVDFKIN